VSDLAIFTVIVGAIVILVRVIEKLVDPLLRRTRNPHSDHDILIKLLERQATMGDKLDRIIVLLEREP